MAQLFKPYHNTLARFSLLAVILGAAGFLGLLDFINRSPYVRYTDVSRDQPVYFSHKHHANLGIDCRYCHTTVESSSFANIPPTKTCMNCHTQMWDKADMLAGVRDSWTSGESIEWNRVHDLPDFVYFNHAIHVNKGVGCATCHGRVDQMPLMKREHPLFMKWCLDCHRNPEKYIRPKELVTQMDYSVDTISPDILAKYGFDHPPTQEELGSKLVETYGIDYHEHRLTNCSICHR